MKEENKSMENSLFYDRFMQLCKERGVLPTPLLKSLGFSPTNMERWKNGSTVNSDILVKIANYFDVSIDYFFKEEYKFIGEYNNIPIPNVSKRMSKTFCLVFNFDEEITVEEATRGINKFIRENGGSVLKEWVNPKE